MGLVADAVRQKVLGIVCVRLRNEHQDFCEMKNKEAKGEENQDLISYFQRALISPSLVSCGRWSIVRPNGRRFDKSKLPQASCTISQPRPYGYGSAESITSTKH